MNFWTVGFVCVATVAAVGVDYATQARQLGAVPGTFPASAYLASVSARIGETAAGIDSARQEAGEVLAPVAEDALTGDGVPPATATAAAEPAATGAPDPSAPPAPAVTRLEPGQDRGGEDAGPRRLTLSGGRSCLGEATGRLCD